MRYLCRRRCLRRPVRRKRRSRCRSPILTGKSYLLVAIRSNKGKRPPAKASSAAAHYRWRRDRTRLLPVLPHAQRRRRQQPHLIRS